MRKLTIPEVPPGNLRVLLKRLEDLHRRAGRPSLRSMARGQSFSHDSVHRLFTKARDEAPNWRVLSQVVRRLADEAPDADIDTELTEFHLLWVLADELPFSDKRHSHDERVTQTPLRPHIDLLRKIDGLSQHVLGGIAAGLTDGQIGSVLDLTEDEVEHRYKNFMRSAALHSRKEAGAWSVQAGIAEILPSLANLTHIQLSDMPGEQPIQVSPNQLGRNGRRWDIGLPHQEMLHLRPPQASIWAQFRSRLQALRTQAGDPEYIEIANAAELPLQEVIEAFQLIDDGKLPFLYPTFEQIATGLAKLANGYDFAETARAMVALWWDVHSGF